jgi:thiamine-monophosphate kinase
MTSDDPFRRRRAIEMRVPRDTPFRPHTPLGAGEEFDSIRRMLERWGPLARRIGDDAAVITSLGERALVASTDASVENVHFRSDWLSPSEIGYRAAAAALSDLAAMGAKPLGMLVAMAIPENWKKALDGLTDGIGEAAEACDAPVLGGDMTSAGELSLTFTVLGTARDVLFRTGARPGDSVYMTGNIGGSGAALAAFRQGVTPSEGHRARFARPTPRIREGIWFSEQGASAAIDISDGISADLLHVACASRVAISIEAERIPVASGVSTEDALKSGEEYELVVTSPRLLDEETFRRRFSVGLTRIGTVHRGEPKVNFTLNGEQIEAPSGYLHFE